MALKKKTNEQKGELIYGIHPIIEVLKAKRRKLISVYTTKPAPQAFEDIQRHWPKYPVAIQYVKRDVLDRMVGTSDHQGVVGWVQAFGYRKQFFNSQKQPFLLMLDGIQDPRNLGAILRSAYCAGVDGVIIVKKGGTPLTSTAIKSSAGLSEYLEIFIAQSATAAVQELKDAGYGIYLATFGGKNAVECEYNLPLCIVVGGEGFGISKTILNSGTQVTLPQRTSDISYNASVAAGILLFLVATRKGLV